MLHSELKRRVFSRLRIDCCQDQCLRESSRLQEIRSHRIKAKAGRYFCGNMSENRCGVYEADVLKPCLTDRRSRTSTDVQARHASLGFKPGASESLLRDSGASGLAGVMKPHVWDQTWPHRRTFRMQVTVRSDIPVVSCVGSKDECTTGLYGCKKVDDL